MAVCTEVLINNSYLGILIIKIDKLYTTKGQNATKTCIHPAMAGRVIKDHQALTENSP